MSTQMIISVMSKDRPGIIADVTGAIFNLGGDLADLNQSVLCGYLTMILFATFDDMVSAEQLIARIRQIDSPTQLDVLARQVAGLDGPQTGLPPKTYIMTSQGSNRKGLVYGISSFCCAHDINILDLATTIRGDTYTMVLQLDLSRVESIADLRAALQQYGDQSGLQIILQHHDLFKVTNEIPF